MKIKQWSLIWTFLVSFFVTAAAVCVSATYDYYADYCEFYNTYGYHNWRILGSADPTCEEGGGFVQECQVCYSVENIYLDPVGHDWHWIVVEDATCQEEGLGAAECSKCGMRNYEPIQPTEHVWGNPKEVQASTCISDGLTRSSCIYCGATFEETRPRTSHKYGSWSIIVAATDHSRGTRAKKCIYCGEGYTEGFYPEGTILKGGDNDSSLVRKVQQKLVDLNILHDSVDGSFGPNTEASILVFQKRNGLTADGIGWPQTVNAILSASATDSVTQSTDTQKKESNQKEESESLKKIRKETFEANALCAVAYLGYFDEEPENLAQYLKKNGIDETYPFLIEISKEQLISHDGYQLYCIVPANSSASVTVNEWIFRAENNFIGECGSVLYESETGEPFLVRGNISDIVPNLQITITDPSDNSLQFYPFMSLKDNTLQLPNDGGVLDFTIYDTSLISSYEPDDDQNWKDTDIYVGVNPIEIAGDWAADGVAGQDDTLYDGTLSFYQDGSMEFSLGIIDQGYDIYYTGEWWYLDKAEKEVPYRGTVGIRLEKTSDSLANASDLIEGEYLLLYYNEEILSVSLVKGDALFPNQFQNRFTMMRAYG